MARSTGFEVTVQMKVAPSHEAKHLAYLYTRAKQLVVNWLVETKPSFKSEKELYNILHHKWYEKLKKMGLKSRLAEDCYRDAANVYTSWLGNSNKNKSKPRIKSVSVTLTPKLSYNLNLNKMRLSIMGYKTPILGYSKTLSFYKNWKIAEAKLIKRGKDWFLHVTFEKIDEEEEDKGKKKGKSKERDSIKNEGEEGKKEKKEEEEKKKKEEEFKATSIVAVDINQDFIMVGNDKAVVEIPTRLDDADHYVNEAHKLQKKYPTKWRYSKHILNRIAHFFRRERNILIDFAKKVGRWVVEIALLLKANVIVLEELNRMIYNVNDLRKNYRLKLYLMQYSRIQRWIEWQAQKYGIVVKKVNPAYSSTSCPRCGTLMKENQYRTFRCPNCGFEENRDYVAVMNLYGRGSSAPLDCPSNEGWERPLR